jgi:hypothetical protein
MVYHRWYGSHMADNTAPAPRLSDTAIASPMIAALENAWTAIREHCPELPPVVITIGGGKIPGGMKLGHHAPERWQHREHGTANALDVGPAAVQRYAELFVGGEGLVRQPHEIFATLLGQAALVLASVRGLKASSRQGRWMNATFAKIAGEEFGVITEQSKRFGYEITGLTDETMITYIGVITELSLTIDHVRVEPSMVAIPVGEPVSPDGGPVRVSAAPASAPVAKRPGARCQCDVPREVHIARKDLAAAPILCGVCLAPFAYA